MRGTRARRRVAIVPTFPALLVLCATLLTQQQAALPSSGLLMGLAVAGVACLAVAWRWPLCRAVSLLLAVALLTFAQASWRAQLRLDDALPEAWAQRDIEVVGRVVDLPRLTPDGVRVQWHTERVLTPGAQVPRRVLLSVWATAGKALPLRAGERWQLTVSLKPAHGLHNFHGFDYEAWLFAQGVRATGSVRGGTRLGLADDVESRLAAIRESVRDRMQNVLAGHPQTGVLVALAIGDGGSVSQDQWQRFRDTGVIHLMSISGLHVTLFAGMAAWLARRLWGHLPWLMRRLPRRRFCGLVAGLCAVVYVALAGWGLPAQRTLYMVLAMAWAAWRGERWLGLQSVALALVVVCLLDPWCVQQIGFWLSFGAVTVLVFCSAGRLRGLSGWREALHSQWAMTIALLPASLFVFQQVSLVGPLANAVAIPLVSFVITPLALFGAMPGLGWLLPPAAWVMGQLDWALQQLLAVPQPMLSTAAPDLPVAVLGLAGALLMLMPAAWPRRWLGAVCCLPLLAGSPPRPEPGGIRLTVLDVGQGQSVLVQTAASDLLFDAGPAFGDNDAGERTVVPQLRALGVTRLDQLVISHDDIDHRGGAASVMAALPVGRLLHTDREGLLRPPAGTRSAWCTAGDGWEIDGVRFDILFPDAAARAAGLSDNEGNCVLRVSTATGSVLIPGDLEKRGEALLLDAVAQQEQTLVSDLLIAPHHGSRGASGAALVAEIAPRWVIYPVGYRNRFGHPAPPVLQRYADIGAPQWRTDCDGAVRADLAADGSWRMISSRGQAPRYWQQRAVCHATEARAPGGGRSKRRSPGK